MSPPPADLSGASPSERPWRDAILVLCATIVTVALSAHFQVNEAMYAATRRVEALQLDEWPVGMVVLLLGLIWLSWRRYRHVERELERRTRAEARISTMLAQNRELAQENLRILDVEHKRLARELHDELGQAVNAIKLDAFSIQESAGHDPQMCLQGAQAIVRATDHIHSAITDMIGRLRPVGLDELGLIAAVEHCIDQWRQRLPHTRFCLDASGALDGLPEPLNLTAYRLIQEGLTNIYKHADAKNVRIALERIHTPATEADELRLSVTDDGRGMRPTAGEARFGLRGMRERVEMIGGTFVLQSLPNQGLQFEARLPAAAVS